MPVITLLLALLLAAVPYAGVPAAASINAPDAPLGENISANWAGYVAESGVYTAVGATWSVPEPTGDTHSLATDVTWVGIGGVGQEDLIQAGTQSLVENGEVTYTAWYELLPDQLRPIPLGVRGGDTVTVSLTEIAPNQWYLYFYNKTTGELYTRQFTYVSSRASAEWVHERPLVALDGGYFSYLPLAQFGEVAFSDAYTVKDGRRVSPEAAGAEPLNMMTRRGELLAVPGPLSGDSFSVLQAENAPAAVQPSRSPYVLYLILEDISSR